MRIVDAMDRKEELRQLFADYTQMLIENDARIADYLQQQNIDCELDDFSKYERPHGRLYGMEDEGQLIGCIALRPLSDKNCELKRLYVDPNHRGKGIAEAMVDSLIQEAKSIGYTTMFLDTMPFLGAAKRLYEKKGFEETTAYLDSPIPETIFMKKAL